MAYGTTIGDAALSAGFPLVAPTDDAREGYDHHNQTRDLLATALTTTIPGMVEDFDRTLPPYAGARTKTFSQALATYNAESPSLIAARARIARAKRGESRCRLAFIGDSRVKTAGVTEVAGKQDWDTYSLPSQVREMLGARRGEIYFDPKDSLITAISGFAFATTGFNVNQITTTGTEGSTVTITLPAACTGFDLWMFRTGNTEQASIKVDGLAAENFLPGSGSSWKRWEKRGLADTTHTVTITIPVLAAGSYTISRIAPYFGETGLTVTNAGRSSSNALHWDDPVWNTLLPTLLDPNGYAPNVVVAQIGTNWGASTLATFLSIVGKLQAAGAVVIWEGFGPRQEDMTDPVFNTRRGLMYDLADQKDLPLIDHVQIIGTWPIANGRGLMNDTVHEKEGGASLEGAGLVRLVAVG